MFLLLIIWMKSRLATSDLNLIIGEDHLDRILFYITFSSSLLSAAIGMTKYFQHGPFRLIPKRKYFGGFFFLFISISTCLVGKGVSLVASKNVALTSVEDTFCNNINITKNELGLSGHQTVCNYEFSELDIRGFDLAARKSKGELSLLH